MAKTRTTRKRLKRGRDWHAWAWRPGAACDPWEFFWPTESGTKPKTKPSQGGKWVRVKFVEVD